MPKSVNTAFSEFINNTVNISKEESDNAKKSRKYIENPRFLCYNDSVPIAHCKDGL